MIDLIFFCPSRDSDQPTNFMRALFKRIAKRFEIKKIKTCAYTPRSNGLLKRSYIVLKEYLKQYTSDDRQWDEWVDLEMLNYNSCIQQSTKYTPFELVFGRVARLPTNNLLREKDLFPTYKDYLLELKTRLNYIQK